MSLLYSTLDYDTVSTYRLRFGKDLFTLGKSKGWCGNSAHGKSRTAAKGHVGSKGGSQGGGQGQGSASKSELHGQFDLICVGSF
jgi:hypothetical protein